MLNAQEWAEHVAEEMRDAERKARAGTNLGDLIDRARHCREYGSFDALHGELLDHVEFLDQEFEAERDRANEHFDARMTAEARVRELVAQLDDLIAPYLNRWGNSDVGDLARSIRDAPAAARAAETGADQ